MRGRCLLLLLHLHLLACPFCLLSTHAPRAATISYTSPSCLAPAQQILGSLGIGGAIGATIAKKMAITDLPQMVRRGAAAAWPTFCIAEHG